DQIIMRTNITVSRPVLWIAVIHECTRINKNGHAIKIQDRSKKIVVSVRRKSRTSHTKIATTQEEERLPHSCSDMLGNREILGIFRSGGLTLAKQESLPRFHIPFGPKRPAIIGVS